MFTLLTSSHMRFVATSPEYALRITGHLVLNILENDLEKCPKSTYKYLKSMRENLHYMNS